MALISEQIDGLLRLCVPYVAMLVLFILNMVSFSFVLSTMIEVPFVVILIYFWAIYRPTLIPPVLIFVVGICLDALSGLPFGLSSFLFLIMRHFIVQQRLFLMSQSFLLIWLIYILVSILYLCAQWFLFGLTAMQWTPITPVFIECVIGALCFPIVHFVLNGLYKIMPVQLDQYSAVK